MKTTMTTTGSRATAQGKKKTYDTLQQLIEATAKALQAECVTYHTCVDQDGTNTATLQFQDLFGHQEHHTAIKTDKGWTLERSSRDN